MAPVVVVALLVALGGVRGHRPAARGAAHEAPEFPPAGQVLPFPRAGRHYRGSRRLDEPAREEGGDRGGHPLRAVSFGEGGEGHLAAIASAAIPRGLGDLTRPPSEAVPPAYPVLLVLFQGPIRDDRRRPQFSGLLARVRLVSVAHDHPLQDGPVPDLFARGGKYSLPVEPSLYGLRAVPFGGEAKYPLHDGTFRLVHHQCVAGLVVAEAVRGLHRRYDLALTGLLQLPPPRPLRDLRPLVLGELVEYAVRELPLRALVPRSLSARIFVPCSSNSRRSR